MVPNRLKFNILNFERIAFQKRRWRCCSCLRSRILVSHWKRWTTTWKWVGSDEVSSRLHCLDQELSCISLLWSSIYSKQHCKQEWHSLLLSAKFWKQFVSDFPPWWHRFTCWRQFQSVSLKLLVSSNSRLKTRLYLLFFGQILFLYKQIYFYFYNSVTNSMHVPSTYFLSTLLNLHWTDEN